VSIGAGWTAESIREFVHEYEVQPYGTKSVWLAGRGVSYERLQRWRLAVFEGDLDRGLVPRKGGPMTMTPGQRRALERERAKELADHEAEIAKLNARIEQLEAVNETLGKAIGLLHRRSEQEPGATPPPSGPSSS
jgi:hypothetical protein